MNKQIYVDAFVLSVKKDRLTEYKKMAGMMAKLCKEYGALSYVEAVEDDLTNHLMPHADFRKIAKTKEDEVVFFSYIVYPNKKVRTVANKKIDAEMQKMSEKKGGMDMKNMPFDMKRLAYGGFKSVVAF